MLRIIEEFGRMVFFDNLTAIHKYHTICHGFRKTHFMGNAKHGDSLAGKFNHYVQNFFDHLRV